MLITRTYLIFHSGSFQNKILQLITCLINFKLVANRLFGTNFNKLPT
ncbi:hypothetical protein A1OE_1156 [Candidatus Endolissoclinum faulkneri L2]|uniref:Uncharacterized protein n=1 Tax=Candidatus Endolissoclinum faulkneri L2 TaxID=1193729 RepID=K7YS11_9PROT|nr:hypothetical protein A1OE_1156 [Candidatus Endolissoclinum faulkneri L2]